MGACVGSDSCWEGNVDHEYLSSRSDSYVSCCSWWTHVCLLHVVTSRKVRCALVQLETLYHGPGHVLCLYFCLRLYDVLFVIYCVVAFVQ